MKTGVLTELDLLQTENEFSKPTRKLAPELIPSSCWMSNLRSELSVKSWNDLRQHYGDKCNWRCEITGTVGKKHPVELHEHWYFDMDSKRQILTGLSMLAPNVHLTMHPGFAGEQGKYELMLDTMIYWNKKLDPAYNLEKAQSEIDHAFDIWEVQSQFEWELDISFLETLPVNTSLRKKRSVKTENFEDMWQAHLGSIA